MDTAVLRNYKIPLILGGISILTIIVSIVLLVKSIQSTQPIRFSSEEASGSALGAAAIRVDVEGAVVHPGVYSLPAGSRVEDALIAAGGLGITADEDIFAKTINRAAKITDGAKLYIPEIGVDQTSHNLQSVVTTSGTSQNGLVSINFASAAD